MPDRRSFIKKAAFGSGLLMAGCFPFQGFAAASTKRRLTILYTSDVHGRIDVFEAGSGPFEGLGGIAARVELINNIRNETGNVLLLDAGDMLRPAPYLDTGSARQAFQYMEQMGYEAATPGVYDFGKGMDFLAGTLPQKFPLVSSNYEFKGTPLEGKIVPWAVLNKNEISVGIFALGNYSFLGLKRAEDTLKEAQKIADKLNVAHGCDLVICLSRLEENRTDVDVDNYMLINGTTGIDMVVSGGTHAFQRKPAVVLNKRGKEVLITAAGWGGVNLGRLDYTFDSKNGSKLCNAQSVIVSKQTSMM